MREDELNRLLKKQIAKKFGKLEHMPIELYELLESVSQSYDHYERERIMIERTMDLSSSELIDANKKLEQQAKQLTRSHDELRQFANIVAHDLKSPLRIIASYVQLVESRLKDKLDDETREFMNFSVNGVKQMNDMLGVMLEYAQLDGNRDSFQWVQLKEVVALAASNLGQRTAEIANHLLLPQTLPEVWGNRTQLVQLFQNIFANSFKFRSERPLKIQLSWHQEGSLVQLMVTDNGQGIDINSAKDIFVMFKRGHNDTSVDGLGMGLSICKKIIENHDGDIHADTEYKDGLRVVMHLKGRPQASGIPTMIEPNDRTDADTHNGND